MKLLQRFYIVGILVVVAVPQALFAHMPTGTELLRAEGDEQVFYVIDGVKRWIESAEAFSAQGFHWDDVRVVAKSEAAALREGDAVSAKTNLILPGEDTVLPDLVPFPLYDMRFATRRGRTILKFSSTYWNRGNGPLVVISAEDSAHQHHYETTEGHESSMRHVHEPDVDTGGHFQQILHTDGTERLKKLGGFHWHSEHSHYHYDDFSHYVFEPVSVTAALSARVEKATRCLWDTIGVDLSLPNAPREKVFKTCKDAKRQGVSVGWGDVYDFTLADQYLDVHDMPTGIYRISLVIDPFEKIVELDRSNNVSVAIVELDAKHRRLKVLAAAGPFPASVNQFADGTLIRGDKEETVYVMRNNRRRALRSDAILTSYKYERSAAYTFPQTVVDTIPYNNLVRTDGVKVYAVNDHGYKRYLRSPEALRAYGFGEKDISDISAVEFASYPDSRLVRVAGKETVYYLEGVLLRPIRSLEAFHARGFTWEEAHVINEMDFASYTVGQEIAG